MWLHVFCVKVHLGLVSRQFWLSRSHDAHFAHSECNLFSRSFRFWRIIVGVSKYDSGAVRWMWK